MKTKNRLKRLILQVVITVLAAGAAHANLVAYWKLDETSGTAVHDSSGHGHNGVLQGGLSFEQHSDKGIMGDALHCDGVQGHDIFVESISVPAGAFTIALWFNPDFELDKSSNGVYLMFWGGPARPEGDKPLFEFNEDQEGTIRFCVSIVGREQYKLETRTNSWKALTWYHLAATFDGADVKLYVNGTMEDTASRPGVHYASSKAYFGSRSDGQHPFRGRLDDIRIYDVALSADEIAELHGWTRPQQELAAELQKIEALIIREPQEAVGLIEKRIAEQRQPKSPPNELRHGGEQLFHLQFLLAKARKAAGSATKDVDEAYRLALEQGVPSLSDYASILVWLFETGRTREYERIVRSLLQDNKDYLKETASKAESMISEGIAAAAVEFLERGLATYEQWRREHPNADVAAQAGLPLIYFQLAKAKEASGASKKEISQAYCRVLAPSPFDWVAKRAAALQWLLDNKCTADYTRIINSSMKDEDINDCFRNVVGYICRDLDAKKDRAGFENFIDVLLAEEKYPFEWVKFVESSIRGNNEWTKALLDYCDARPGLKSVRDCKLAEGHVADGEFKKAARLYQDILDRSTPEDDRNLLEFQVDRCTFLACQYSQALSRLKNFVADKKTTSTNLVRQARLMIARSYIQLGQIDTALQELGRLTVEYPDPEQAAESAFLIGYCYMLQNRPLDAAKALDRVAQDYPESSWANKARLCLAQLKNVGEGRTSRQDQQSHRGKLELRKN